MFFKRGERRPGTLIKEQGIPYCRPPNTMAGPANDLRHDRHDSGVLQSWILSEHTHRDEVQGLKGF